MIEYGKLLYDPRRSWIEARVTLNTRDIEYGDALWGSDPLSRALSRVEYPVHVDGQRLDRLDPPPRLEMWLAQHPDDDDWRSVECRVAILGRCQGRLYKALHVYRDRGEDPWFRYGDWTNGSHEITELLSYAVLPWHSLRQERRRERAIYRFRAYHVLNLYEVPANEWWQFGEVTE